jgi:hypothetical protein
MRVAPYALRHEVLQLTVLGADSVGVHQKSLPAGPRVASQSFARQAAKTAAETERLAIMSLLRPRTTAERAIAPVLGGVLFFGLLALALWGVAALASDGNGTTSELLASRTFQPGPAESYAETVAKDGPILFPDLLGTDGDKSIILDHAGDDPKQGWRIYLAHPKDKPLSCKVTQQPRTRQFTDCDGRTLNVEQLAPPPAGIAPKVTTDGTLVLDLTPDP